MAVFDTPITTNEQNLQKVLKQGLPVALYLFSSRDQTVEDALSQAAKANVGKLLIARIDVNDNPGTYAQYGRPALPALVTVTGDTVKSKAESARPADVGAHIDYLLGRGAMPQAPRPQSTNGGAANGHSTGQGKPVKVTDATFQQEVLNSSVPVFVDFWAEWCGPCRMIAPTVDQMASEFAGKVKVVKLNTDENPRTAGQYNIRGIPTFITFKNGKIIRQQSGANPQLVREMMQQASLV
jgi:thioredoxin 1